MCPKDVGGTANSVDPDQTAYLEPASVCLYCLLKPICPNSYNFYSTVQILCIGTDRSLQTAQTKIRLLLKKQSDQALRCLPFHQHLLDALMQCYIKLFYF